MFSKSSLEMLDAVARLGSFTAAAEVLHKVPSAISYSVRQRCEWQISDELRILELCGRESQANHPFRIRECNIIFSRLASRR